jgi:hypothetical protein
VNRQTAHNLFRYVLIPRMIKKISYITKLYQLLWQRSCVMSDSTMHKSILWSHLTPILNYKYYIASKDAIFVIV